MVVKNEGSVEPIPIQDAERAFIQPIMTRMDGAQQLELRRFLIKPGGRIPAHLHPEIEHVQYVLSGRYTVKIGGEIHEVKPGDVVHIPPNTPHYYENNGDEDAVFICIIPQREYTTISLSNL